MGKVKEEIVEEELKSNEKKNNFTIKTLKEEVKKKIYQEKVDIAKELLEEKYKELEDAQQIVDKLKSQIEEIENTDIREVEKYQF